MKKYLIAVLTLTLVGYSVSTALAATKNKADEVFHMYKHHYTLYTPGSVGEVPEVTEVTLPGKLTMRDLLLYDTRNQQLAPFALQNNTIEQQVPFAVSRDGADLPGLYDQSTRTSMMITKPDDGQLVSYADLEITFQKPTVVSGLGLAFDSLSKKPETVSIKAVTDDTDAEQVIFVTEKPFESSFSFPKQKVRTLIVTLSFKQTLMMSEVTVTQPDPTLRTEQTALRFLAKPASSYILYTDLASKNAAVQLEPLEAGDLFSSDDVKKITLPKKETNELMQTPDADQDGVVDEKDNCPAVPNEDQADKNTNQVGDACEDFDRDHVINSQDNCPEVANSRQTDEDGDSLGDACDDAESRLTERSPWLPWVAMAGAGIVIGGLFYSVATSSKLK